MSIGDIQRVHWFVLVPAPYPLLPIAVLQVVHFAVVPVNSDAHQGPWEEAVLRQNHKIGEKTTKSLDHPWKQKCARDQFIIYLSIFNILCKGYLNIILHFVATLSFTGL